MPRVFYMFFIILISFVAIFVIFMMFVDHSTNHLIATDLQQAVTEDLEDSRDDSGRMEKGTYNINESEFKDNFAHHITIKDLNTSHTSQKDYDFIIRFQTDNSDNDKDNTDYINDYSNEEAASQKTNQVTPVRAVQVIAVPKKDANGLSLGQIDYDLENPKSSARATKLSQAVNKHKYVSSVELQEFDLDANSGNRNPRINGQSSQDLFNNSSDTHKQTTDDTSNNNTTDLSDNN